MTFFALSAGVVDDSFSPLKNVSLNTAFAFVANLRNLAKAAEKEIEGKARIELLGDTTLRVDGIQVTLKNLTKAYKHLVKNIRTAVQALTFNQGYSVNLTALAKADVQSPTTRALGWSAFPDQSGPLTDYMATLTGKSEHFHTP